MPQHTGAAPGPGMPRRPDTRPDGRPDDCADVRVDFLTGGTTTAAATRVRPAILASWQRSRDLGLRADRVQVPFVRDPDIDTPLTRSADPVLRRLADRLADQEVSIILTDPVGLVLSRRTPDAGFERALDRVLLAPGFSYAERFAGTNGIGTALETGAATRVFGHEHYAEDLDRLACAAVPIHDPVSGRLAGVLDLTCWRKDTDALLLTLAETTAEQIQHAMLERAGSGETAVLRAYRQACHRHNAIVLAVTPDALAPDAVTLNDRARSELSALDQTALLALAAEVAGTLEPGARRSVDVTLRGGTPGRMACVSVEDGGAPAGLVLIVRAPGTGATPGAAVPGPEGAGPQQAGTLPGLAGQSLAWRQVCARARAAARAGEWIAFTGEPGTGKLALARTVLRGPGGSAAVLLDARDAAEDRRWWGTARAAVRRAERVVLAHPDVLSRGQLRRLTATLREAPDGVQVAVTLPVAPPATPPVPPSRDDARPELAALVACFAQVIEVPALRLRPDDIPALVDHFLAGERTACAPDARHLLTRAWWPGNVEQLRRLLRGTAARHRGTITADDLPAEIHSVARRVLTPIESLERDAIVAALPDAGGHKGRAAGALGISRATIYRRIHAYGITAP